MRHRGRKLSDSSAKVRLYHEVSEAHLSGITKVDLTEEPVTEVSTLSMEQSEVLSALGIGKPATPEQLALL